MKLGTKLKLSFFIVAMLPLLLMVASIILLAAFNKNDIEESYGIEVNSYFTLVNPTKLYKEVTNHEIDEIEKKIKSDPLSLLDASYLDKVNKKLKKKMSFMAVTSGDTIIYKGNLKDSENLDAYLMNEESKSENELEGPRIVTIQKREYIVKINKVKYDDNTSGHIFIFTEYGSGFPQVRKMIGEMMLAIVIILVITSVLLTVWIYRSVMKPLKEFTLATRKISEGNLEFELKKESDDEFGELFDDFNKMRIRLKEASEDRIRDDNESKILIRNISHDLKTPLTSIKGYVEGIMDGIADTPEKMDKYIRTIYNKANDMDKLIGELTEYSRIDTNRVPYNFSKVKIVDYFDDCVDENRIDLEQKGITLNYINYVAEDTLVIADAEQMKRVINNIISNSIKYMDKKQGIISIRILDEEEFIHIELEDNGKGIEQKDLPKIFERFYRTDESRNSSQGGNGIGLSIARKIIEEHGGRIWATSKIGMGTTIHISLRKYMEMR